MSMVDTEAELVRRQSLGRNRNPGGVVAKKGIRSTSNNKMGPSGRVRGSDDASSQLWLSVDQQETGSQAHEDSV
jgi:hypothetical protein